MINYDGPRRSGKSNKIIRRALIEALKGKMVLVLSFTEGSARFLFEEALYNYRDKVGLFNHTHQTIEAGGGTVFFRPHNRTMLADVVFIDEYQHVLKKLFGNVQAIAGTTMKAEMVSRMSEEELSKMKEELSEEQYKQEFVCTFKED